MGPLGVLTPQPGVSYLFQTNDTNHSNDGDGSLWGIANGNHAPSSLTGGALMSPPDTWTPSLGDAIVKIDGKLKVNRFHISLERANYSGTQKIIAQLLKELDQFARNAIKDELATLDPLLRNQAVPDNGREQYDFEGFV